MKRLLCRPLDIKLRKRMVQCFLWSMLTWTLKEKEERRLLAFEVLEGVGEKRVVLDIIKGRRQVGGDTVCSKLKVM